MNHIEISEAVEDNPGITLAVRVFLVEPVHGLSCLRDDNEWMPEECLWCQMVGYLWPQSSVAMITGMILICLVFNGELAKPSVGVLLLHLDLWVH